MSDEFTSKLDCPYCGSAEAAPSPNDPRVGICFDCVAPLWITGDGTHRPTSEQLRTILEHEDFNRMAMTLRVFHEEVERRVQAAAESGVSLRQALSDFGRELTLASLHQVSELSAQVELMSQRLGGVPSDVLPTDWSDVLGFVVLRPEGAVVGLTEDSREATRRTADMLYATAEMIEQDLE